MMRKVFCICALTILVPLSTSATSMKLLTPLEIPAERQKAEDGRLLTGSTEPADQNDEPCPSEGRDGVLTVFLTGNELGALRPCGCSGGQLGGFDRRSAILNSVQPAKRLIVDTGLFVEGTSEQELIKFNIVVQSLGLLDYDLVNLTEHDFEIAKNLGLLDNINSVFNVITSCADDVNLPAKFTKLLPMKERTVTVTIAAFDAESTPIEHLRKLFTCTPSLQAVNILILERFSADTIASIAKTGLVNCLLCPAQADEPRVISEPNDPCSPALVVSVGRFGKYVGRLQIYPEPFASLEDKLREGPKLTLRFSAIPVTEDLPQAASLVELYKAYQQLVKEANLLEKQPRFSLPNGLEYVGSRSCNPCHEYEYEKWTRLRWAALQEPSSNPHALAYATLERVGSQFDPECVRCHVVGAEYESGFVSAEKSDYLKNVGCENCHGPGSQHIRTLGKAETVEPKLDCIDCHTPEESTNYAESELAYLEKIIHWREPNAVGNVKK